MKTQLQITGFLVLVSHLLCAILFNVARAGWTPGRMSRPEKVSGARVQSQNTLSVILISTECGNRVGNLRLLAFGGKKEWRLLY
jgi:hypothetical protein